MRRWLIGGWRQQGCAYVGEWDALLGDLLTSVGRGFAVAAGLRVGGRGAAGLWVLLTAMPGAGVLGLLLVFCGCAVLASSSGAMGRCSSTSVAA